jgi:hypothetical protein
MAKKSYFGPVGGILALIGSLIYIYVVFAWYSSSTAASPWLSAAQFLSPFVAALAIVSAISLFFISIGTIAGKMKGDKTNKVLWKFVILGAVTLLILAAGGSWFYLVVLGFILTYIGAMIATM